MTLRKIHRLLLIVVTLSLIPHHIYARGIRTDAGGNNSAWSASSPFSPSPSFPAGLLVNPLGTAPQTLSQLTSSAMTTVLYGIVPSGSSGTPIYQSAPDAQAFGSSPPLVNADVPGGNALNLEFNLVSGSPLEQVVYIYIGSASAYAGTFELYDSSGNPIGPPNNAWEIEFNCNTSSNPCTSASLQWAGVLYTAGSTLLNSPNALNQFVYNNGVLYPPPGWMAAPVN
jgi:hypothetical protein